MVCPAARTLTPSSTMAHAAGAATGADAGRESWRASGAPAVLEGAERFEEAQGDVAMPGVLADQQGHLLAEDGQVERPVGQQQHPAGLAAARQVAEEEPGRQAKAQQGLHAFDHHHGALQTEAGARPLHQEALVLAPHGALGPVRAHGHQPEQGVEVEAAERPNVGADAQVTLGEQGLDGERQAHGAPPPPAPPRARSAESSQTIPAVIRASSQSSRRHCPPRSGRRRSWCTLWLRSAMSEVGRLWK